ncbi:MAG: homocysteine S-methyltransferase family protein [Candidatus Neomarinimicrobiota bacterium]
MSYITIRNLLADGRPITLDGGIGTEMLRRGVRWRQHGIEDAPEVVRQVHSDYLAAGADVITAHTFNLTSTNFINFFRDREHMAEIGAPALETKAQELCALAVGLARDALRTSGKEGRVPVAGSISPVQHPFRPDLAPDRAACADHHARCVQVLAECGVDLIFFEAMNNLAELRVAVRAGNSSGLPVWVSLIPDAAGTLLSGESLREAGNIARTEGAAAVLLATAPADVVTRGLPAILNGGPAGAQAIIGRYNPPSWKPDFYPQFVDTDDTPPRRYAEAARAWRQAGATIIGGSSGTTPAHIAAVKQAIG